METKRALDNWRMPKLQEIFTTVAIVCRRIERSDSQFSKMFSRSFYFEQVKALENFP